MMKFINDDTKKYVDELNMYLKKYGWIMLMIIVIISSAYFRLYTVDLPRTDEFAKNTVYSSYQNNIYNSIKSQYPNLPSADVERLANKQFNDFISQNSVLVSNQINEASAYFKSEFRDTDGQTYLIGIDPFLWYGIADNYVKEGHWGNIQIDGKSYDTLRGKSSREPRDAQFILYPFIIVVWYKIMNLYTNASVMAAAFYTPVILIGFASLFAFLIGRRLYGNFAGFVCGMIISLNAALLGRTIAGSSDTDNIITFCELLTVMLFVYTFSEEIKWKQYVYLVLTGLSMAVYAVGHQSWWHIFDTLLGCLFVWIVYQIYFYRKTIKDNVKNILNNVYIGIVFMLSTYVFYVILKLIVGGEFWPSLKNIIISPFTGPFAFLSLKEVGIKSIWPNVMTTVAELNSANPTGIISSIGGSVLFWLSVVGLILLFLKKNGNNFRPYLFYGLFFSVWFVSAFFASLTSLRFNNIMIPSFAIGLSVLIGWLYTKGCDIVCGAMRISSLIFKGLIILITFVIIILPMALASNSVAYSEVPMVTDGWYNAIKAIDNDTDNGYITSWWDYGHWFVALGKQRVTFDGGDQGDRIYWVGKLFLTDNESEALGILRMLNCDQEQAVRFLTEYLNEENDVKAINNLYSVFNLNKEAAKQKYLEMGLSNEQVNNMIKTTHCDNLYDHYIITSGDMVGKAGVWAHFGGWDFNKALMFNKVKGKDYIEGTNILINQFNLTEDNADTLYADISEANGDNWISQWPGYVTGITKCVKNNMSLSCSQTLQGKIINIQVNLNDMSSGVIGQYSFIFDSIVYVENNKTIEKINSDGNSGLSLILIPNDNTYNCMISSTVLANSMFTRLFFMNGLGTTHFTKFNDVTPITGERVITWKVNYDE